MPGRRWGARAPADVDEARERLVDAAEACVERFGVERVTVEAVADEAHVSRATVYRYFKSRDELLLAVLLREAESFFAWLGRAIDGEPDIGQRLVQGVLVAVEQIRRSDRLLLLFMPPGSDSRSEGVSKVVFELGREFARPYFDQAMADGTIRPELSLDDAIEWILRIAISFISIDSPVERDADEQAEFLARYLLPPLLAEPVPIVAAPV